MDDDFGLGYVEFTYQDLYGLIWIASRNGLFAYDGYSIKQYTNDPADSTTLPNNNVFSVGGGEDGSIWACLGPNGLTRYDRDRAVFESICPTGMGYDCMSQVSYLITLQDTSGLIWVGTSRGLLLIDDNAEIRKWYTYSKEDSSSLFSNYIIDLFLDDRNRLWVGTTAGLNLLDRERETFVNSLTNTTFPKRQVIDINQRPGGSVIACPRFGDNCLLEYDEESRNFNPIPEFQDRTMGEFKIAFDHNKNMWISSRGVGAFMQLDGSSEVISYYPGQAEVHGYRNV